MNKLISFARLDFLTVKPYFTIKNLIIFATVVLFLSVTSGSIFSGIYIGMLLGTIFLSYPFAVGEKCNIDALYMTLSINRKTVVLGRYIFLIVLNICAVLFAIIFSALGAFISRVASIAGGVGGAGGAGVTGAGEALVNGSVESLLPGILLAIVFFCIQAFQLPFLFKYNYSKARFFSFIPYAALMAIFFAFTIIGKDEGMSGKINAFIANMANIGGSGSASGGISAIAPIVVAAVVLILVMFMLYKLSLHFYEKREF